jgi:hypothetical protein
MYIYSGAAAPFTMPPKKSLLKLVVPPVPSPSAISSSLLACASRDLNDDSSRTAVGLLPPRHGSSEESVQTPRASTILMSTLERIASAMRSSLSFCRSGGTKSPGDSSKTLRWPGIAAIRLTTALSAERVARDSCNPLVYASRNAMRAV